MRFGRRMMMAAVLASLTSGAAPVTCVPTVREGEGTWWRDKLARNHEIAVACGEVDLVMLGDSITHYWEIGEGDDTSREVLELERRYSVVNGGFGGAHVENILWDIVKGGELDGYRAKAVMLMIGTNDFARYPLSAEDGAKKLAAILKVIRAKQPQAKVILLPIFPAFANPRVGKRADCNALAKKLADGKDVIWCDFNEKFLDAKGEVRTDLMPDRLHPNNAGYVIWREAVTPLFRQICGK